MSQRARAIISYDNKQDADPRPAFDHARYTPDGTTEQTVRLLGDLKGKRVLELGFTENTGSSSIAFAKQGATAIAVEPSSDRVATWRRVAESEGVRVEWHEADLADLAFLRADSIDLVFSAQALGAVEDLGRVFRQAHRVLRQRAPLVFSLQHPFSTCVARDAPTGGRGKSGTPSLDLGNLVVHRSYFDTEPLQVDVDDPSSTIYPRLVGSVFSALGRAGFRVDAIIEPAAEGAPTVDSLIEVPTAIIWRARKEGV